jgi:hypothetical protein
MKAKKKKPIKTDYKTIIIGGLIDLIVGILLILINKLFD